MSRSYRKPYCAVTGVYTDSHDDKKHAARCVRRSQDAWVRDVLAQRIDPDEVPVPDRLECKYNDVWSWGRDGHKRLQTPDAYAWSRYCLIQLHVELGSRAVHFEMESQALSQIVSRRINSDGQSASFTPKMSEVRPLHPVPCYNELIPVFGRGRESPGRSGP